MYLGRARSFQSGKQSLSYTALIHCDYSQSSDLCFSIIGLFFQPDKLALNQRQLLHMKILLSLPIVHNISDLYLPYASTQHHKFYICPNRDLYQAIYNKILRVSEERQLFENQSDQNTCLLVISRDIKNQRMVLCAMIRINICFFTGVNLTAILERISIVILFWVILGPEHTENINKEQGGSLYKLTSQLKKADHREYQVFKEQTSNRFTLTAVFKSTSEDILNS